jgi:transcriptional regulator with XRE-family HTH domain
MSNIVRQPEFYRLENKTSLQRLASELDVSFSIVSRWFAGKTEPSKIQQYHIEKFIERKGCLW